jgi:hypothetical protein
MYLQKATWYDAIFKKLPAFRTKVTSHSNQISVGLHWRNQCRGPGTVCFLLELPDLDYQAKIVRKTLIPSIL